jgi:protein-disulfide isomerase
VRNLVVFSVLTICSHPILSRTRRAACAVALAVTLSGPSADSVTAGLPSAPSAAVGATVVIDELPVKGLRSAPITVVGIFDFRCPYCAQFVRDSLGRLDGAYIKAKKIRYVFWDFPLRSHPESFGIHLFAGCAAQQNAFWQVHDLAFRADFPSHTYERLALAVRLGLNAARLDACLNSPVQRRHLGARMRLIRSFGIEATPTFLIGTTIEHGTALSVKQVIRGAREYDELRASIERVQLLEFHEDGRLFKKDGLR